MPEWVFADRRLNSTSRSIEPSMSAGSKPSNGSGGHGAASSTWRASSVNNGRYAPSASASAIDRSLTAVANSIAP